MDLEITPEASDEERQAIAAALARLELSAAAAPSAWQQAGRVEALGLDEEA